MTRPRLLSEQEFKACFAAPMQDVTVEAAPAVDIWPYVDGLAPDAPGIASIGDVHRVYRDANDRFDQVLLDVGRPDTFLVIVVGREPPGIIGHHLLDLNEEYGF